MKFDVIRTSDYEAGRIGAQCAAPWNGCKLNKRTNTWELEVIDLDDLLGLLRVLPHQVKIVANDQQEDTPLLELLDAQ